MSMTEQSVKETLKNLQNQIQVKSTLITAISSIKSLLIDSYTSASPSLRNSFYAIVCSVERTLQTSYFESDFWLAGKELFELAENIVIDSSEREYLKTCIAMASEQLDDYNNNNNTLAAPPAPRSTLRIAQELLATIEESNQRLQDANSNLERANSTVERAAVLMNEMVDTMQEYSEFRNLFENIEAAMQDIGSARPMRQPPASKEVIEKLPVVTITKELMDCWGSDVQCAVCRENLCVDEKMQELPCKHLFHQLCLKPWMEINNSCPVCRYELPTDNDAYESWKERERLAKMNENTLQSH